MNLDHALRSRPLAPAKLAPESMAAHKVELRRWDEEAVSSGMISAEQLRRENSVVPLGQSYRILNLEDVCARH